MCRAACTGFAALPWRLDQLSCDIRRAALELQTEEYWKGEALLYDTWKQASSMGEQASLASIQVLLGDICLARQRTNEAVAHYARAAGIYHRLGDVRREEIVRNQLQMAFDKAVFIGGMVTPLSHPPDPNPDISPGQ